MMDGAEYEITLPPEQFRKAFTYTKFENIEAEPDMVNHPPHYETGGIECIDAMTVTQGKEAVINFCVCNAFKYIWRHGRKNGREDLAKAVWYLNKAISLMETSNEKAEKESST